MSNPCLSCWTPTTNGPRCPDCTTSRNHETPTRSHRTTNEWKTTAKQAVALWRETHGDRCPGWRRDPHYATDLTADHWTPGDPTVLAVMCRSCNSAKADAIPTEDDAKNFETGIAQ